MELWWSYDGVDWAQLSWRGSILASSYYRLVNILLKEDFRRNTSFSNNAPRHNLARVFVNKTVFSGRVFFARLFFSYRAYSSARYHVMVRFWIYVWHQELMFCIRVYDLAPEFMFGTNCWHQNLWATDLLFWLQDSCLGTWVHVLAPRFMFRLLSSCFGSRIHV